MFTKLTFTAAGQRKIDNYLRKMDKAAADFLTASAFYMQKGVVANIPYGPDREVRVDIHGNMESQVDPSRIHLKDAVGEPIQTTVNPGGGKPWMGVGNIPVLNQIVATYRRAKTGEVLVSGMGGRRVPIWKVLEFGTPDRTTPLRSDSPVAPRALTIHKGGHMGGQVSFSLGPVKSGQIKGPPFQWSYVPGVVNLPTVPDAHRTGKAPFRKAAFSWMRGAIGRFKARASAHYATEKHYTGGSW